MTTTHLSLHTEPYGSTGNIGENFLRLLGTPAQDPLLTVIREAVQNIADAAQLGRGPEILIRVRHLSAEQLACLRERILLELPEETSSWAGLRQFLSGPVPVVLEICDFGTTGLGGPTRADRIPVGTKRTDFINFLRNVGTPRDTEHGGGTYGFGKASLYAISRCRTIIVDTLLGEGIPERRLIGCHVGARFERVEAGMLRQFTGRHWWGVRDPDDGIADPATADFATELAAGIGLPNRPDDRPGTSIMILDPSTEDQSLHLVAQRIVENLLWSFWPRMMSDIPAERRFSCRVMVGEEDLPVPSPEEFPPLDLFCKAMRAVRTGNGSDIRAIASERPIKRLGQLAIEKGLRAPRRPLVEEDSLFPTASHHIALMRPVELIVKYMKGNALPDDRIEWAGVFLVDEDDEVERAFALAEPPAHDDWVPSNLEKGHARTFVRVALHRLEAHANAMGEPAGTRPSSVSGAPPLAKVAGRLGAALVGVSGDGAGVPRRPGKGGGSGSARRGRRAKASAPVFSRLMIADGVTLAVFSTEVIQDDRGSGGRLSATAAVALEGGAAGRLDPAIAAPEVVRISSKDGLLSNDSRVIEIDGTGGHFEIFVRIPADCAVTVDVELDGGDGS